MASFKDCAKLFYQWIGKCVFKKSPLRAECLAQEEKIIAPAGTLNQLTFKI